MIKLENICKSYDEKTVLDNIMAEFPDDSITCIMGESGAGKTTLVRIIAGLENADRGTVSGAGVVYRRHSNRGGHHGIERSGVSDYGRHSNLRGCNRGHVSIARRIQIRKDRNRLTHNCAARSGKRFPRCRIGLQCFDCGVAAPHSSHCYRRFNNSRHSNLMRRKHSSFGVLVCIINIPKSERGITT